MSVVRAARVSAAFLSTALLAACGSEPVEPTTFKVRVENVAPFTQLKSGLYNTRLGATQPGPLAPGEAYEFTFTAGRGHKLSFASMFGQSNDWVFATPPGGIELYEGNTPISGDVTSQISLWDVGSEVDEEPAIGPHTGPRQSTSTDGPGAADPNPNVRKVVSPVTLTDGSRFNVPAVDAMIRVTVSSNPSTRQFTVRIQNVADDASTLQTSQGARPVRISPGVWALTTGGEPLFTAGAKDRGLGLEAIAEMGQVTMLSSALSATTGVATPVSPGVFVVHESEAPLFKVGAPDLGQGLERIAEEGNVTALADLLKMTPPAGVSASGVFNTPEGAANPGAARPGSAYTFEVSALPGERLSLVTMFGMSNDWFFGTVPGGVDLFDAAGNPVSGDFSSMLRIYDVGTELSEEAGIGPNTGPQQASPNSGLTDTDNKVREVAASEYATPVAHHLKLTISR